MKYVPPLCNWSQAPSGSWLLHKDLCRSAPCIHPRCGSARDLTAARALRPALRPILSTACRPGGPPYQQNVKPQVPVVSVTFIKAVGLLSTLPRRRCHDDVLIRRHVHSWQACMRLHDGTGRQVSRLNDTCCSDPSWPIATSPAASSRALSVTTPVSQSEQGNGGHAVRLLPLLW